MLHFDQPRGPSAVDIQPLEGIPSLPDGFALRSFAGLMCGLLLAGSLIGAHNRSNRQLATPPWPPAADMAPANLSPTPYDFSPSDFRQRVLDRQESGQPLPDAGQIALQEGIEDRQALSSKYYQEILSRDAVIQVDKQQLARIAQQLGLPKDRLASPSPPPQEGVGGMLPGDSTALSTAAGPAPGPAGSIASLSDLANLVTKYLSLPCPLPAGDERCAQAVDHARAELARGHGLDVNRPDATPTLGVEVGQPFGPTDLDLEPLEQVDGQMVHFHEGVDLEANYDEPVMAAASGTVVFAGVIPSGALTVEIAHAGGLHTLYLHEDEVLVQQGQQVQKGQIIGLVGATGLATGPHVHFQVNDPSGKPTDPMQFLG